MLALALTECGKEKPADSASAPMRDPNVLLITFDTTRPDHFSCYGYAAIRTPTVDSLADRGIRYARCYSPVPITLPSHASIMTGLYPFQHGQRDNGAAPLAPAFTTLAELLASKGYRTGAVVGAYVLHSRFGLNQGFQFYGDDFSRGRPASKGIMPERNAAAVTDAAIEWLAQPSSAPYFLWAHYFDPHMPYAPPGLPPNTPNQLAYDQELVYADAQLGRLIRRVDELEKQTGRATLILFTADHGESLLEHGEPTHAFFVYEATIRVPLIVAPPVDPRRNTTGGDATGDGVNSRNAGAAHSGKSVVDEPVALVDIFPSVLGYLSIPLPYPTLGRPLPRFGDRSPAQADSDRRGDSGPRAIHFETHMPFHTYGWSPLEGVLVASRKYIHAPKPELYDLAVDPRELRSLYTASSPDATSMQQALQALKSIKLNIPSPSDAPAGADDASRRALRALGYAGGIESPPQDISVLRDPKDMIEWHVRGAADAELRSDSAHAVESVPLLAQALRADPDNRFVLALLSDLLDRQEAFAAVAPVAQDRLRSPLPPPHDRRLPTALALALARNQRSQEAIELLTPLVEKLPDSAEIRFALGATCLETRQTEQGLSELRRAVELDPKNRPARVLLGDTLFQQALLRSDSAQAQREFQVALDHYLAAIAAMSDLPPPPHIEGAAEHAPLAPPVIAPGVSVAALRVKIADAQHRLGRTADAITELQQAVQSDPDLYDARSDLAALLLEANRPTDAEAQYREAIRIRPTDPEGHYNLGGLYLNTNRPELAVAPLQEAARLKPDDGRTLINLGIALFRTGNTDEAKSTFRRAAEFADTAAEASHSLGIAFSKEGNMAEAIACFDRAIESNPAYAAAIDERIGIALRERKSADAVRVLRNAVAHMPDNARYLNVLAQILATSTDDSIRNGAEALELARRANRLTGDRHAAILTTLAAALAETGDFDQAIAVAERALAIAERTDSPAERIPAPQSTANRMTPVIEQLRSALAAYRQRKPFRDARF